MKLRYHIKWRNLVLVLSIALAMPFTLSAQVLKDRIPKSSQLGCELGYQNEDGMWVIDPQFERAERFDLDSTAIVSQGGLYGIIDYNGNFILECRYPFIQRFKETHQSQEPEDPRRRALIERSIANKAGFYLVTLPDSNHQVYLAGQQKWALHIPHTWHCKPLLYEGVMVVKDPHGQRLASPFTLLTQKHYFGLEPLVDSLWIYTDTLGRMGLLHRNGTEICPAVYPSIACKLVNGLIPYYQDSLIGFINPSGEIVHPAQWDSSGTDLYGHNHEVKWVKEQLILALAGTDSTSMNLLDFDGNLFLESPEDTFYLLDRHPRLTAVRKSGKWGVVDDSLHTIAPLKYDSLITLSHEAICLYHGSQMDVYNWKKEFLFTYPKEAQYNYWQHVVELNNTLYYHDLETHELLLTTTTPHIRNVYDNGTREGQMVWVGKKNGLCGMLDKYGNPMLPYEFDTILMGYRNGYAVSGIVSKDSQAYYLDNWLNGEQKRINPGADHHVIVTNSFAAIVDANNQLVFSGKGRIKHLDEEFYDINTWLYSTRLRRSFQYRGSLDDFTILNEEMIRVGGRVFRRDGKPAFEGYTEIGIHKKGYYYGYNSERRLCLLAADGSLLKALPDTIVAFYNYLPDRQLIFVKCEVPWDRQYTRVTYGACWRLCHFPSLQAYEGLAHHRFKKPFTIGKSIQVARTDRGHGLVSNDLQVRVPFRYSQIYEQGGCYFLQSAQNTQNWGVADSAGHLLLDAKYDELSIVKDSFLIYNDLTTTKVLNLRSQQQPQALEEIDDLKLLFRLAQLFGHRGPPPNVVRTMFPEENRQKIFTRHYIEVMFYNYQINKLRRPLFANEPMIYHTPKASLRAPLLAGDLSRTGYSSKSKNYINNEVRQTLLKEMKVLAYSKATVSLQILLSEPRNRRMTVIQSEITTYRFSDRFMLACEIDDLLNLTPENSSVLEERALRFIRAHSELSFRCTPDGLYFPQMAHEFAISQTHLICYKSYWNQNDKGVIKWEIPLEEVRPMLLMDI